MIKFLRLFLTISVISFSTINAQVFICGGEYSDRFHASPNCRGLNNCRSEIYEIDEYDAIDMGRTPCQIEYEIENQFDYSNSYQNYSAQEPKIKWMFYEKGNPIDGFYRQAVALNKSYSKNDYYAVNVFNKNKNLVIEPYILNKGLSNYLDLTVEISTNNDLNGLNKVLFYFNSDIQFYEANFSLYSNYKGIVISSAKQSDIEDHVTKSEIINMLKNKNDFHVRLYFENDQKTDLEFKLNGSTSAINKTVDISKILGKDEIFDKMFGAIALSKIYNGNNNFDLFIKKYSLDREEIIGELVQKLPEMLGEFWYSRLLTSSFKNETIVIKDLLFNEVLNDNIFNILDYSDKGKDVDIPYAVIEDVPIYPGCENAAISQRRNCFQDKLNKHIRENFRYPEIAQQMGVQGRVYTQFIIEKDGSITNIKVRGPDINLEREAERIISLLPKMTPGFQNGKPIRVPFSTPITFRLQ